jgi:hypothetical protein
MWMYLDVFQCIYSMFQCIWKYLNLFQCILNVFTNIVIEISPSHSHYNVFAMQHPPIHLLFNIHNDSLPNMLYHYTLLLHSYWFVPIVIQSMKILYTNFYLSHLYINPHSTFHVVTDCTEHYGAQVIFINESYYNFKT